MAGGFPRTLWHGMGRLGEATWTRWDQLIHTAAVIGTVLLVGAQPRSWARPARHAFMHQIVVLGVESVAFVSGVAVFVGITIVVHLVFWIGLAGQSQLLGPLLVTIVVRELAPVLVSLIMIVRSGSAMATELGIMKIDGRVDALAAQEGAPLLILVLPRVLGAAVSAFCLTIVFILVAFASGYLVGALGGKGSRDPLLLATSVLGAIGPQDVLAVLGNSVVPGLYTAASCCVGGLDVGMSLAEVPRATQRALMHSVIGLFGISTIVTVLTYIG